MKKQKIVITAVAAMMAVPMLADVNITFQSEPEAGVFVAQQSLTPGMNNSNGMTPLVTDSVNHATYQIQGTDPVRLTIGVGQQPVATLFASPEDNITVNIPDAGNVVILGTPLMEGIAEFEAGSAPLVERLVAIRRGENKTDDWDSLYGLYRQYVSQYIRENRDSQSAAYALLRAEDEDFTDLYNLLGDNARNSIIYPMVENYKAKVERRLEADSQRRLLESGTAKAPDFTLPDLGGKDFSLDSLRGKWVVLDFWGSWCRWCIKGFPELKEAYKKYDGRLEVVGIDCRDTPEQWKDAVAKYALPWINVYNDMENTPSPRIDEQYGVTGFPTKVIISPEGIIKKIVVGEDPEFYTYLESYIK